jgi:preprotein translocase subunit SecE
MHNEDDATRTTLLVLIVLTLISIMLSCFVFGLYAMFLKNRADSEKGE